MWTNLIGAFKKTPVHLAEPTLSQETIYFEAMCRRTHLIIGETPDTNVPLWTLVCDEASTKGLQHDHWFCHLCTKKKRRSIRYTNNVASAKGRDHTNINLLYL